MPKASEVAAELRKLADVLDKSPDTLTSKPDLTFWYSFADDKDKFLNTARILPHPLTKNYPKDGNEYSRVSVDYESSGLRVSASIYRTSICQIIKPAQPAVYDCEFTLSVEEDAGLGEAGQ